MTMLATKLLATALTCAYNLSRSRKRDAYVYAAIVSQNVTGDDLERFYFHSTLAPRDMTVSVAITALGGNTKEARLYVATEVIASVHAAELGRIPAISRPLGAR